MANTSPMAAGHPANVRYHELKARIRGSEGGIGFLMVPHTDRLMVPQSARRPEGVEEACHSTAGPTCLMRYCEVNFRETILMDEYVNEYGQTKRVSQSPDEYGFEYVNLSRIPLNLLRFLADSSSMRIVDCRLSFCATPDTIYTVWPVLAQCLVNYVCVSSDLTN